MKNVFKHLCSLLLLALATFVLFGCATEVEISLNIPNRIAISEKANVTIEVNIDDYEIIEIKSSNPDVLKYADKVIEGIKIGTASLTATILYRDKEYSATKEVEVYKDHNYELDVDLITELEIGEKSDIFVVEKSSNKNISDFSVLSSNEAVIKVENNKVYALSEGKATIVVAATYDEVNLSKEVEVNVVEKKETVLKLNLPEKIYAGQLFEIEVTYLPDNVKLEDFTIESSDLDCFEYYPEDFEGQTYDAGTVTLTIVARYEGKLYSQRVTFEVLPELLLEVDLPDEITTKEPVPFKVYLNPGKIEITDYVVSSTNTKAFTIENGVVTPVGVGKGMITLSCEYDGASFSASYNLKVVRYYPDTIESNIQEVMFINESLDVTALIEPAGELLNDFEITSSNSDVVSVSGKKIEALKEGTSEVVIKANGIEKKYQISVTTFGNIKIVIDENISLNEVASYKVIATPSNKEIKNFSYQSTNNEVILVNKNLIFGSSIGSSTITVSYTYNNTKYEVSQTVEVEEIKYPIERLFITGANGVLVGTSVQLDVKKYPSVGFGEVEYLSSDSTIATVAGNVVTGVKEGKTTIIARVKGTDVEAKFEVKVIKKNDLTEVNDGIYNNNPLIARYYEDSITMYNELIGGIKQTTYTSFTSTQMSGDVDGYSGMDGEIEADKFYQQQVHLLEVPSNKDIKVIPWANLDGNIWSLTTVKGLVENFEKANPGYKVVAAVNGDFFDINAYKNLPYSTTGENISDGEFYKTSNTFGEGGGTLGFTNDGSNNTLIGGSHAVRNSFMTLAIYDVNGQIIKEFKVEKFNEEPGDNETSVYYGTYNENKNYVPIKSLNENTWVVSNADLALPSDTLDFYGKGTIDKTGQFDLQKGQFSITSKNADVQAALSIGTKIRVQYEFNENDKYANVTSATGYNGVIYDETHGVNYTDGNLLNRAPRTVIGMKEDGTLVMMVVDGRQGADNMYGCDAYELTAIMRTYGCVKAYNVDGGGSSTMVIRTDSGLLVTNSPSDGRERSDGNCIVICVADPSYQTEVTNLTATSATVSVKSSNEEFNNKDLYISLDSKFYQVVNGKVELTNLFHNSDYSYRVYYKENGEYIATQCVGVIKTHQANFRFLGFTISETADGYVVNSYSDDIDKCGNVDEMAVTINDYTVYLKGGTATISKKNVGDRILSISIEYWYLENGDRQSVVDNNPTYFLIK